VVAPRRATAAAATRVMSLGRCMVNAFARG
jgi:hypothetical protein